MNQDNLISQDQALTLAGVSAQTLARFVETGYLTLENGDGHPRYLVAELQALFGIDDITSSPSEEAPQQENSIVELDDIELEEAATEASHPASSENELDREVQRLSILNEMYEKLLERREQEIKDLHDQRKWLRERIEKLEQKAERDQLLLISETQLITKLVKQKELDSPVRKALTWLGVISPDKEHTKSTSIEFNKRA